MGVANVDPADDQGVLAALENASAIETTDVAAGAEVSPISARLLARVIRRVQALETQTNRAAVVSTLPANAPLGALIRLQGDASGALYLGNGPTRPLTKLLPTAL